MKKTITVLTGLFLITGVALAQTGPGPGTDSNQNGSNYVNQVNDYHYLWGTNCLALTNAPKAWSNYYQHTFSGPANDGKQGKNRFGKRELPDDVQTIVKNFQRDRTRVMDQLKTCSDAQRQELLKEMEQMRTRLRDQICEFREQAQQQAEQMRNRFGNNRDRILSEGAGQGSQHGGRDR